MTPAEVNVKMRCAASVDGKHARMVCIKVCDNQRTIECDACHMQIVLVTDDKFPHVSPVFQ